MTAKIFRINSRYKYRDVNKIDNHGKTQLHHAASYGITILADFLLSQGANIDAQDENGWTPLHFAAQNSCFDMIDLLLNNNANPVLCDKEGNTPLWIAMVNSFGKYQGVKSLLKAEANLYYKNNPGRGSIYIARMLNSDLEKYKWLM